MAHLIEIEIDHFKKWPELNEYIKERPNMRGFVLIDQIDPVSIMIADAQRIHYFLTEPSLQCGNFATQLIEQYIARYVESVVTTAVPKNNIPAIKTLLNIGFKIIGFNNANLPESYVFEFRKEQAPVVNHTNTASFAVDLVDVLTKTKVVEVLPIRI